MQQIALQTTTGLTNLAASAPLVVAEPAVLQPANQDTMLGTQLSEQYQRAVGGIREVIVFGAMMVKLDVYLSTCGQIKSRRGKGAKGMGVEAWLQEFAPNVSRPTAYRFKAIAEGLYEEFKLGKRVDLQWLLTADPDQIQDKKLRGKREAILEFIEGKSKRQLLLAFEKGEHGAGGGHDPKKNKKQKLTPEEEEQICLAACRDDLLGAAQMVEQLGVKYTAPSITDAERDAFIDLLRGKADEIEGYVKTPVHQRSLVSGLKLMEGKAK